MARPAKENDRCASPRALHNARHPTRRPAATKRTVYTSRFVRVILAQGGMLIFSVSFQC